MNKLHVNQLTLDEKIGQLLMIGFEEDHITDHMIDMIKNQKAGNIILFARNIKSPEQLFLMNQTFQKMIGEATGIPAFISIDQEGGMVTRIHQGATFFPGAMTIAATNKVEHAYHVGDKMGEELIALGINMNLAPVLDVNNNPKNPVIGVRSYSDDPKKVSTFASAYVKGLQKHVIATGKHFPGHGDTHVDSHLALPVVKHDKNHLESFELIPFKDLIEEGIQAIMSAHIHFPALTTDGLPVTLSHQALTDLLRIELEFEGLIITDGIEMKAIDNHYGSVEATLMAIKAGANLVCICHNSAYQLAAVKRIKEALKTGEIDIETINERVQRVLDAKAKLKPEDLNQTYEQIKPIVENKATKDSSYNIVKDALTLIKGHTIKLNDHALFIGTLPAATSIADEDDATHHWMYQLKAAIPSLDAIEMSVTPDEEEIERICQKAKHYKQIIIGSYNGNVYRRQITLIDRIIKQHDDVHVIAMRNPYDLYYSKNIKNYVALYEYTPQALQVLIGYLKGEIKPKGKAPIVYE